MCQAQYQQFIGYLTNIKNKGILKSKNKETEEKQCMLRQIKQFLFNWATKEVIPSRMRSEYFELIKKELKPGDVLLVAGRTRMAKVIQWVTGSHWTHVAVYIGNDWLIESIVGIGVRIASVDLYVSDEVRIMRHKFITPDKSRGIINIMADNLGGKYDSRAIFDLLRLMAPIWLMPRKFRSTLFRDSRDRFTCSELTTLAFKKQDLQVILHQKARLTVPGDFDRSVYFDVIKPHPLDVV